MIPPITGMLSPPPFAGFVDGRDLRVWPFPENTPIPKPTAPPCRLCVGAGTGGGGSRRAEAAPWGSTVSPHSINYFWALPRIEGSLPQLDYRGQTNEIPNTLVLGLFGNARIRAETLLTF